MGYRANPRLARSKPPTGKVLRDLNRQRHNLDLYRIHTASPGDWPTHSTTVQTLSGLFDCPIDQLTQSQSNNCTGLTTASFVKLQQITISVGRIAGQKSTLI